jgi:internalin A
MSSIRVCVLIVLTVCLTGGSARADEPKVPKPLPKEITDAWVKAGAEVGWMNHDRWTVLSITHQIGRPGDMPVLAFEKWPGEAILKLPCPDEPFLLDLSLAGVNNARLKEVAGLKKLKALSLVRAEVNAEGINELSGLKGLEILHLDLGEFVDDRLLEELAKFKQLRHLSLGLTHITDGGMKHIAKLTNLQKLDVSANSISDKDLKDLAELKKLASLDLHSTDVTDKGVKELAGLGLNELRTLNLGRTKITDSGLKEVAALKELSELGISSTAVTDVGLKHLAGCKTLRELNLADAKVTKEGVAELQKSLPECKIRKP